MLPAVLTTLSTADHAKILPFVKRPIMEERGLNTLALDVLFGLFIRRNFSTLIEAMRRKSQVNNWRKSKKENLVIGKHPTKN